MTGWGSAAALLVMEPRPPIPPADAAFVQRLRRAIDRPSAKAADAEALARRAEALLGARFGPGEPAAAAFAAGYAPLSAEHTHYFDGFGLLLALPDGVAVALRSAPGGVWLTSEGVREHDEVLLGDLLRNLARQLRLGGLEAALVSTLPLGLEETLLGAAAVAALRALEQRPASDESLRMTEAAVAAALDRPFGPAYLLAGQSERAVTLVDAGTLEREGLDRAASDPVGWGLVAIEPQPPEDGFYEAREAAVQGALTRLQQSGFEALRSLRGLEHHDLTDALDSLAGLQKRVVRYLVTEDRRVPRLFTALSKGDGQLAGALLLMSQAALREDWGGSSAEADFVAAAAEGEEGIYGARAFSGGVLVVGRPFLLPPFLERVAEAFAGRFGTRPATRVL